MRLSRLVWFLISAAAILFACVGLSFTFRFSDKPAKNSSHPVTTSEQRKSPDSDFTVPFQTIHSKPNETAFKLCIGETVQETLQHLGLKDAKWSWADEPPGILRGVSYSIPNGGSLYLYIAQGESLFRRFNEKRIWDYEQFLGCKVGGIQYKAGDVHLDIGPAVPFQWRSP